MLLPDLNAFRAARKDHHHPPPPIEPPGAKRSGPSQTAGADNQCLFQIVLHGSADAFVTKFPLGSPTGLSIVGIAPNFGGNAGTMSPQITGAGFHEGATAQLSCGGQPSIPAGSIAPWPLIASKPRPRFQFRVLSERSVIRSRWFASLLSIQLSHPNQVIFPNGTQGTFLRRSRIRLKEG